MNTFDAHYINVLTTQAKDNPRLRQHKNIHQSLQDPCQALFNAIELGSYIRPHRHASDPKSELFIAIRGEMGLVTFNDYGIVTSILRFSTEKYGSHITVGVQVSSQTWHTVVALSSGCVLLEIKEGPFDPIQSKDLPSWAPEEGSALAQEYLHHLYMMISA